MEKLFNIIKVIGLFLGITLLLFMIIAAFYGAMFFWFILKISGISALITFIIVFYVKARTKKQ